MFFFFIQLVKEKNIMSFLMLASIPVIVSLSPLVLIGAAKVRAIDGVYELAFVVLYYLLFNKSNLLRILFLIFFLAFVVITYSYLLTVMYVK
jgi:hypothetical protein